MTSLTKKYKALVAVAIVTVAVFVMQGIWLGKSQQTAIKEFDKDTYLRMERVALALAEDVTCFELFSQRNIPKGSDFYILAPDEVGELDTLETFYWKSLGGDTISRFKQLHFSIAAAVEVNLRFHYLHDGGIPPDSFTTAEQNIKEIFENSIAVLDENLEYKVLDTFLLRQLLLETFESRESDFNYQYALYDTLNKAILAASSENIGATILDNGQHLKLFPGQNFVSPLFLYVWFPDKEWQLLKSFIPFTIGFVLLILGLAYFLFAALRSTAQERQLAQMKIDLVNNMTHEFNTPISNISLALDTLAKQSLDNGEPKRTKMLEIISQENSRLKENIDKVLKISMIQKGPFNLDVSNFNVHQLLEELLFRHEFEMKNKNGNISLKLNAKLPIVRGDNVHLGNAINNIVENAIKYSGEGFNIEIETKDSKQYVCILIKDNGPGIAKENIPYVFDKFYRVQDKNQHDVKGFGLGLFYTKRIIQAHQGNIKITSKMDSGTLFTLNIPKHEQ